MKHLVVLTTPLSGKRQLHKFKRSKDYQKDSNRIPPRHIVMKIAKTKETEM